MTIKAGSSKRLSDSKTNKSTIAAVLKFIDHLFLFAIEPFILVVIST